jgi:hypothetical protein
VFPFGWQTVTLDTKSRRIIGSYHQYRPYINKASGNTVYTDIFLNPQYKHISGIIFSNSDVCNHGQCMGDDFICIHNPFAQKVIPDNFIRIGCEYRAFQDGEEWKLIREDF